MARITWLSILKELDVREAASKLSCFCFSLTLANSETVLRWKHVSKSRSFWTLGLRSECERPFWMYLKRRLAYVKVIAGFSFGGWSPLQHESIPIYAVIFGAIPHVQLIKHTPNDIWIFTVREISRRNESIQENLRMDINEYCEEMVSSWKFIYTFTVVQALRDTVRSAWRWRGGVRRTVKKLDDYREGKDNTLDNWALNARRPLIICIEVSAIHTILNKNKWTAEALCARNFLLPQGSSAGYIEDDRVDKNHSCQEENYVRPICNTIVRIK